MLELRRGDAGAAGLTAMAARFFKTQSALRRWFCTHHQRERELLVGCWKVGSGQASITWPESVDEALCVGWIDGVRKRIDEDRYTIRFTPRKPTSIWSAVNIARVQALQAGGRMQPAGLAAYEARRENRIAIYSFEQASVELPEAYAARLAEHAAAAVDFAARAPSCRKAAVWWVVSAKQEATRERRLQALIEHCARSRSLPQFTRR